MGQLNHQDYVLSRRPFDWAHSIEVLKTTVSEADSLLERVLESLDSKQAYAEPLELGDDPLRQAVGLERYVVVGDPLVEFVRGRRGLSRLGTR
jgi:hypothetical protein